MLRTSMPWGRTRSGRPSMFGRYGAHAATRLARKHVPRCGGLRHVDRLPSALSLLLARSAWMAQRENITTPRLARLSEARCAPTMCAFACVPSSLYHVRLRREFVSLSTRHAVLLPDTTRNLPDCIRNKQRLRTHKLTLTPISLRVRRGLAESVQHDPAKKSFRPTICNDNTHTHFRSHVGSSCNRLTDQHHHKHWPLFGGSLGQIHLPHPSRHNRARDVRGKDRRGTPRRHNRGA